MPFSWATPVARTAAAGAFLILLFAVTSINGNAAQESFNSGVIWVVLASMLAYAGMCVWIVRRQEWTRLDRRLLAWGGIAAMGLGIVGWFVWSSVRLHRVL